MFKNKLFNNRPFNKVELSSISYRSKLNTHSSCLNLINFTGHLIVFNQSDTTELSSLRNSHPKKSQRNLKTVRSHRPSLSFSQVPALHPASLTILLLFITATHHSTVVHYDYLKDLDNRYHPRLIGTVQYCPNVRTGLHNRYTSLHPYIFFQPSLILLG